MDFTEDNDTDEIPKCLVTSPKLACFRNLLSKDIIPWYRLVKNNWISFGSRHLGTNYIIFLKCWMQRNSGTFRLSSASLHDMTLIIVIQLLLHLFLTAKACTEIRVTTEDNNTVVIGRSMEWSSDLWSDIIVEPQRYFYEVDLSVYCTNTDHADAPLQNWTNRYTVITSMLTAGMLPVMEWIARDWLWVRFIYPALPSTRYISSPNSKAY